MSKMYYVNGSTVRELGVPEPVRRERQSREEIERARREKNARLAVRRNREKAQGMSRGYVAFLSVCVILSAVSSFILIGTQASVSSRMRSVAPMQSQIEDLRADNDARYKEITTSVDLNYIKDVAMNQLGMSYATEDQVVYYSVEKNNFMDQYSDIPQ